MFIVNIIILFHQKTIKRNAQIALHYSKTDLSMASKKILSDSQNKNGYITNRAIKKLESNIDKESVEAFMKSFELMEAEAKETVKNQKFPTCFDHLK